MVEIRQIADDEDRGLNAQIVRFIRAGLDQYRDSKKKAEITADMFVSIPKRSEERWPE